RATEDRSRVDPRGILGAARRDRWARDRAGSRESGRARKTGLQGRRLQVEGLRVEVEAHKGRTPSPRIERLSVRVMLPAGVPEKSLPSIERAIRNCPAYGTLVHPPDVELTVLKEPPERVTLAS